MTNVHTLKNISGGSTLGEPPLNRYPLSQAKLIEQLSRAKKERKDAIDWGNQIADRCEGLNEEIERIQEELGHSQKENESIQETLIQTRKGNDVLCEENKHIQEELDQSQKETDRIQASLDRSEKENKNIRKELEQLCEANSELQSLIAPFSLD